MKKIPLFLIIILLLHVNCIDAQEVISTAGSSFQNSTTQLSWTLGESVIETYMTDQSILTQGFQQSRLTVTANDQISVNNFILKVYPNPVSDELNIEVGKTESIDKIHFSLFDINGKMLYQKKVEKPVESIDMHYYFTGSYLLMVCLENGKPLQTFKVIKH